MRWIGAAVSGVFLCSVLLATVLPTVQKVKSGRGLDTFFDGDGVEWNYIGHLVLLGLIPIAVIVGLGIRWWQLREERDFKKKFGGNKKSPLFFR